MHRDVDLILRELSLPVPPSVRRFSDLLLVPRPFARRYPVDRRQQLESERSLEALHEPRHAVEPLLRLDLRRKEALRFARSAGHETELELRSVALARIASYQVPFRFRENVPKVLCVGAVPSLRVPQTERLTR